MRNNLVVFEALRPEELSRTPLRRFGPSKRYEESIEKLHHQLSGSFQVRLKEASWGLEASSSNWRCASMDPMESTSTGSLCRRAWDPSR